MRSVSNLLVHPLIQSHRCDSVFAHANSLAVGLVSPRRTIHELEHAASASGNVRDRSRAKSFLRRSGNHALIDLNRSEPPIQRVTLGSNSIELLVPLGFGSAQPAFNDLLDLAAFDLLSFLQFPLFLSQLAHLVGINPLEAFLLLSKLVRQR